MKRNCLVLLLFSFMLLLTANVFALTADISMRINGVLPDPNVIQMGVGNDNRLEFWMTNSSRVVGFSLGFKLSNELDPYSLVRPYGNLPLEEDGDGNQTFDSTLFMEHGVNLNFVNTFAKGNLLFNREMSTRDTIFFGGANAMGGPTKDLPLHASTIIAYSIMIRIPAGQDSGQFCILPIFVPPAGAWKIDGGTNPGGGAVNPDFQGQTPVMVAHEDHFDPTQVAPACFVRDEFPCLPPVFTAAPAFPVNKSHGSNYTFHFNATEGGNSPAADPVTYTTDVGTIDLNDGTLSVPAPGLCGTTPVTVTAHNACLGTTDTAFTINWTNTNPYNINCPTELQSVQSNQTYERTFTAMDLDAGDVAAMHWTVASLDAPVGSFVIDLHTGLFAFNSSGVPVDIYTFTVTATDPCQGTATCEFDIEITQIQDNIVQIKKTGEAWMGDPLVYQGTYTWVPISLVSTTLRLAGYNLLIHYDPSVLSFVSAKIGPNLAPCTEEGSGWEYFTYRFGAVGNCNGPCPSGLLRLVALAETNNGPSHPGCDVLGGPNYKDPYNLKGVIANLKFYVSNDRTFECQYSEIGFAWLDCSDNTFSDTSGNKLYIAADSAVHTFEWDKWLLNDDLIACEEYPNIIGVLYGGFCPGECLLDPLKPVYEVMFFMNGGVDIACADSIDARGDINLNGIANEIADAVLFTNFFLRGISAFADLPAVCGTPTQCAQRVQGKVAATDVNNDGHVLTVGDLVYLLRIIVGDALPFPKLAPFASGATVNFANGSVSTESGGEIGAVYATFAIDGAYNVSSKTNMQVDFAEVNGELKVLVYSGLSNLSNRIASGSNELFTVTGSVELKSVEVADYNGNMLTTRVNKTVLPTSFTLSQNVPNPFNPTTKLGFALPNQTEWTLNIYNVAGQLVKSFNGNNVGNVSVEWDASMAPSGVYFYKLNAGSYSDTKKMVLMK